MSELEADKLLNVPHPRTNKKMFGHESSKNIFIKSLKKVMLVTECSMSDNVEADNPNVSFIKPCNLCPYMKKIDLEKILDCLENDTNEIILDNKTIEAARKSVIRMTEIGR